MADSWARCLLLVRRFIRRTFRTHVGRYGDDTYDTSSEPVMDDRLEREQGEGDRVRVSQAGVGHGAWVANHGSRVCEKGGGWPNYGTLLIGSFFLMVRDGRATL
jgi:hypothetical protein